MRQIQLSLPVNAATHFGFAYDLLARCPGGDGSVDAGEREAWLDACAKIPVPTEYASYYARVKASFPSGTWREFETKSRLLVGHGIASGAEVGLTTHHAWGVPVIPGSALKGLVTHYVDTVYGADANDKATGWQGPTWSERRGTEPPGREYSLLFGAPAQNDGSGARRGGVEFHDALMIPGSSKPWAVDVLTPHQVTYYRAKGAALPNDWDSPIPVGFITVRPGTRFLLAVTGGDDWTDWVQRAIDLLTAALDQWGIGGKTAAGYGRLARSA